MFTDCSPTITVLDLRYNQFEMFNSSYLLQINDVRLAGNPWTCSWLVAELILQANNPRQNIHFGSSYLLNTLANETQKFPTPEKIDCYDYSGTGKKEAILRHIIAFHSRNNCDGAELEKKVLWKINYLGTLIS